MPGAGGGQENTGVTFVVGPGVSFPGNENVLELVVMCKDFVNILNTVHFKRVNFMTYTLCLNYKIKFIKGKHNVGDKQKIFMLKCGF